MSNYRALHVVADELEREGHVTFGVIYRDVFVPIAQHKLGHIEGAIARWADAEKPVVVSELQKLVDGLAARLDSQAAEHTALTAQVAAIAGKVNAGGQAAPPAAPPAPTPPPQQPQG